MKLNLILPLAALVACEPPGAAELSRPPPPSVGRALTSACDFSQPSSQVVLAAVTGNYGAMQELELVRADGTHFIVHRFGAERAETKSYIYIQDVDVTLRGEHILASRGSDGAIVVDRQGMPELIGTVDEAAAFLAESGVAAIDDALPLAIQAGEPPAIVLRKNGAVAPLPDYHGEPYVNVEAVKKNWATVWSYSADREWRVDLNSGEIASIEKVAPSGMRPFVEGDATGSNGQPRLYYTLVDDGGFITTLRSAFAAGVYHSPDGATGWSRIGPAVRDVNNLYVSAAASGTYVIQATMAGNRTASWGELPAGEAPVIGGPFIQLVRPSTGKQYTMPGDGVLLTDDGSCAIFSASGGMQTLNVDSGARTEVLDHPAVMTWIPITAR